MLQHGSSSQRSHIVALVLRTFLPLSLHKSASNVVECCLEVATATEKAAMVEAVLLPTQKILEENRAAAAAAGSAGVQGSRVQAETPLQLLLVDQYG
jgi:hypothetical protein